MAYKTVLKKIINHPVDLPSATELRAAQEAFLDLALAAHSRWSMTSIRLRGVVTSLGYQLELEVDTNASRDLAELKAVYERLGAGPLSGAGVVAGVEELWHNSLLSQLPEEYWVWLALNRTAVGAYSMERLALSLTKEFVAQGGRLTLNDYNTFCTQPQHTHAWPVLFWAE